MVETRLKQTENGVKAMEKKLVETNSDYKSLQKRINMRTRLVDGRITIPDKRMNSLEMENHQGVERCREANEKRKGIWYTFDEPFTPKCKCRNKKLFLAIAEEEGESEGDCSYEDVVQHWPLTPSTFHSMLWSMDSQPYINTIKLKGILNSHPITILIDSDATDKFIDPKVVTRAQCSTSEISNTLVTIANGTKITSSACVTSSNRTNDLTSTTLPTYQCDDIEPKELVAILNQRVVGRGNKEQVLIQWNGGSAEDATWEDYEGITKEFPKLDP
ncbi:hypothetical protein RJ639_045484 [Escallonia herrerae]|uniref:Chromo domain-containing protein n=1 Tax=Escallonia herrerae TaxID=1293975 RepID=A0AA88W7N8_9ASTE|nr:hypothetical protein RJ639_045484 [Escallonia herrerae]